MRRRKITKLVRHAEHVAEVDVELLLEDPPEDGWGPYLSANDAMKLDAVRRALEIGDIQEAMKSGRVYRLTPLPAA